MKELKLLLFIDIFIFIFNIMYLKNINNKNIILVILKWIDIFFFNERRKIMELDGRELK